MFVSTGCLYRDKQPGVCWWWKNLPKYLWTHFAGRVKFQVMSLKIDTAYKHRISFIMFINLSKRRTSGVLLNLFVHGEKPNEGCSIRELSAWDALVCYSWRAIHRPISTASELEPGRCLWIVLLLSYRATSIFISKISFLAWSMVSLVILNSTLHYWYGMR